MLLHKVFHGLLHLHNKAHDLTRERHDFVLLDVDCYFYMWNFWEVTNANLTLFMSNDNPTIIRLRK